MYALKTFIFPLPLTLQGPRLPASSPAHVGAPASCHTAAGDGVLHHPPSFHLSPSNTHDSSYPAPRLQSSPLRDSHDCSSCSLSSVSNPSPSPSFPPSPPSSSPPPPLLSPPIPPPFSPPIPPPSSPPPPPLLSPPIPHFLSLLLSSLPLPPSSPPLSCMLLL